MSLLVACWAGSCSTRTGHAAPSGDAGGAAVTKPRSPDAGETKRPKPDAGGAVLRVAADDDCAAICAKLIRCKHGPWDTVADCVEACEGANEDDPSSKTYRCAAKATSCAKLRRCGQ